MFTRMKTMKTPAALISLLLALCLGLSAAAETETAVPPTEEAEAATAEEAEAAEETEEAEAAPAETGAADEAEVPAAEPAPALSAEELAGVWVMAGAVVNGVFRETGMPRDSLAVDLRADGTLSLLIGGEIISGTWSAEEGVLHTQAGDFAFGPLGEMLRLEIGTAVTALSRTSDSLETVIADRDGLAEALVGRWRLNRVETFAGESVTRAELESEGLIMLQEFTADGQMTLSTLQNGEVLRSETYTYEVVGSGLVLINGGAAMEVRMDGSLLGTARNTGWYYWLRWDEPQEAEAPADPALIGLWRIVSISDPDGSNLMGRDLFDAVGFDETLEFTADGRSTMITYRHGEPTEDPNVSSYAITEPGVIVLDGQYVERYTLESDRLTLMERDTTLVFERAEAAEEDEAAPAEGEAAAADEEAPAEDEPAPAEGEAAPADEAAPAESEAAPADEAASAEGEAEPADEAVPAEGEAEPADEAAPAEGEAAPAEDEAAPAEGEAVPADEAEPSDETVPAEGEAAPEEETPADEEPFDAVAAITGAWRLDSIAFTDGTAMTREELNAAGYDEKVSFTAEGSFSITAWSYGSVRRSETHAWELTGANFMTLDGTVMLPFGFHDGKLVLIRRDGQYFYTPDTGEGGDPEPAPIDEALLGRWALTSMSAPDGTGLVDRATLESLGIRAETEFTADHRWTDTHYAADGSAESADSAYAVFKPGVISSYGAEYTYTVEGDQLTLTSPYLGAVMIFTRIPEEEAAEE